MALPAARPDSPELPPEDTNIFAPKPVKNDVKNDRSTARASTSTMHSTKSITKPEIVAELRCDQVRWFYARKSTWLPFCGRDSLLVEVHYRLKQKMQIDDDCPQSIVAKVKSTQRVSVLDGMYEVNIQYMKLESLYNDTIQYHIRRGTWFTTHNWQPLQEEQFALDVESHHLQIFRGQRVPREPVLSAGKKPVMATMAYNSPSNSCKVEWNSVIDVHYRSSGVKGKILSVFTKNTTPISRGYKDRAVDTDCLKPIKHLIFVIPGVGQKRYPTAINENTGDLRTMVDKYYYELYSEQENQRIQLLAIEWRSKLVLDGGNIDLITPRYLEAYRDALNTTALDLMYYLSPLYGEEIFTKVVTMLNNTFHTFMTHNPSFLDDGGKVSILGHSLGSVIAYDIVQKQSPDVIALATIQRRKESILLSDDSFMSIEQTPTLTPNGPPKFNMPEKTAADKAQEMIRPEIALNFNVHKLMCIGSPLAVFLQMRQATSSEIVPKNIEQMLNLFHPLDVVAYRLEPLLSPHYAITKPVKVPWAETTLKNKYVPDWDHIDPELQSRKTRQRHDNMMFEKEPQRDLLADPSAPRMILAGLGLARSVADIRPLSIASNMDSDDDAASVGSPMGGKESDVESPTSPTHTPVRPPRVKSGNKTHRHQCAQSPDATVPIPIVLNDADAGADKARFDLGAEVFDDDDENSSVCSSSKDGAKTEERTSSPSTPVLDRDEKYPATFEELREYLTPDEILPHRYDFMLRQARTELGIVKALSAHFVYWQSPEVALWILYAMFGPIGEPPNRERKDTVIENKAAASKKDKK